MSDATTICSWNILTTYPGNSKRTVSQELRTPSITSSIQAVAPDIYSLYEVRSDNTQIIQSALEHRYSRSAEYSNPVHNMSILQGSRYPLHDSKIIEYPMDYRKAIVSTINNIRVASVHLSFNIPRFDWRVAQVQQLLVDTEHYDTAIIMADFNCMPWQKPRRLIRKAGFISTAEALNNPKTFPALSYKKLLTPFQRIVSANGLQIDDIYVKGLTIEDCGVIEGDSDHLGLWVTVTPTSNDGSLNGNR